MRTSPLTAKQEVFAREYVANGGNGKAAYRSAYNSTTTRENTVECAASVLRNNPKVAQRIIEIQAEYAGDLKIMAQRIICSLLDLHDEAVADGKLAAAIRCLELLGRCLGMWAKHPIQANVSVVNYHDSPAPDGFALDELDAFAEDRRALQAETVIQGER